MSLLTPNNVTNLNQNLFKIPPPQKKKPEKHSKQNSKQQCCTPVKLDTNVNVKETKIVVLDLRQASKLHTENGPRFCD